MRVVHLMASPFYGGPERQVLGLARHLPSTIQSAFVSFAENGRAQAFLNEARRFGFESKALVYNTPRFFACIREIADELRYLQADLLCCNGYKPDLIGWRAARRVGIPAVSIAHGWTAATWKVRMNEQLDRLAMRWMDAVVCVSKAQAERVHSAGIPESKIITIQNGVGKEAFVEPTPERRAEMLAWFDEPPRWIVGSAGRLSPEKGHNIFIEAAARVVKHNPGVGFVLFGGGPLREDLERLVAKHGMQDRFVLAGFRSNLSVYLPNLDLAVMASFTEGLPVFLLESCAAGVPMVATNVGGIPEVIDEGQSGHLVPPGNPAILTERIISMFQNDARRTAMGRAARARVRKDFSFTRITNQYEQLFQRVLASSHRQRLTESADIVT